MEAKEIAKELYDQVVKEGYSTPNCYSLDFKKWSKEIAINRARTRYAANLIDEIVNCIENI